MNEAISKFPNFPIPKFSPYPIQNSKILLPFMWLVAPIPRLRFWIFILNLWCIKAIISMKKIFSLILICSLPVAIHAQKKNKSKGKETTNYSTSDSIPVADSVPPPVGKSSKKGKETTRTTNFEKKDSKTVKKGKNEVAVNFKQPETDITPVADTSKRFTGIIKYRMTTDDPADRDSMFIIFGENQVRVTMFTPGYREGQVFETNSIISFRDSTFIDLDIRSGTYKIEKLGDRNPGFEFTLANSKKTGPVMNIVCQEYKGEMTTPEGDAFEAACLINNNYQYMSTMDYNFMNIQPLVMGYKIVLGFRTKTSENESTYILAYKIDPGNTSTYFDLSPYQLKK
jgi:hypothetical protein